MPAMLKMYCFCTGMFGLQETNPTVSSIVIDVISVLGKFIEIELFMPFHSKHSDIALAFSNCSVFVYESARAAYFLCLW